MIGIPDEKAQSVEIESSLLFGEVELPNPLLQAGAAAPAALAVSTVGVAVTLDVLRHKPLAVLGVTENG